MFIWLAQTVRVQQYRCIMRAVHAIHESFLTAVNWQTFNRACILSCNMNQVWSGLTGISRTLHWFARCGWNSLHGWESGNLAAELQPQPAMLMPCEMPPCEMGRRDAPQRQALRAHFHTGIFSQFRYRSPPPMAPSNPSNNNIGLLFPP